MTNILVYDTDAEMLEDLAIKNDLTVAEIIELFTDKIEDIKAENHLI